MCDGNARDHPAGPEQHRGRGALAQADEVDAEVHAIGEVDIRVTRRPEHDLVAPGGPTVGMGRGVYGARVRLHFSDQHCYQALARFVLEHVPKQPGSDIEDRAVEEGARRERFVRDRWGG